MEIKRAREGAFKRVRLAAVALSALVLMVGAFAGPACASAFAVDPEVTEVSYARDTDGTLVKPEPINPSWNIAIGFSTNVTVAEDGADDSFIERNLARVHLYKADGSDVANWHASVQGGGKRVIYIELEDWLEPLTEYKVVVDAGLEAADDSGTMQQSYVSTFKTGASCRDGLSAYQNLWIALGVLLLVAGVAVQAIRVRRSRR